jgi:hypothetical protein
MPLASYFALHWYGPGLSSAVSTTTPAANATIKGRGRLAATGTITPTAYARINTGKPFTANGLAVPFSPQARISGRARMAAVGRVNALTQDDVTGAVLEARVEGGYTVKQILQLLAAFAAGKTDITDLGGGNATVVFRNVTDTAPKITASVTGSERTGITITS